MPAIWRNRFQTGRSVAVAVASLGLCGVALAGSGGPEPAIQMTWDATGDGVGAFTYNPDDFATTQTSFGTWTLGGTPQNPGPVRTEDGWRYRGGFNGINNAWTLSWDCVMNTDPFVDATINVTNNSASTQTFFIFMPLNILPTGPGVVMDGSVSASLSSQSFFNPATLAAAGTESVYQAYINGGLVKTLWDPGYSLTAGPLSSAGDTANFNNTPNGSLANQLAIQLKFTLSAGDSASVTGIFNVVPVPGPAGLSVFALFGALGGRRRRRA
jgi:hypothetical protein